MTTSRAADDGGAAVLLLAVAAVVLSTFTAIGALTGIASKQLELESVADSSALAAMTAFEREGSVPAAQAAAASMAVFNGCRLIWASVDGEHHAASVAVVAQVRVGFFGAFELKASAAAARDPPQ